MKHLIHMLALTLSMGATQLQADTPATGIRAVTIDDGNTRALEGFLWYPAMPSAPLTREHQNGVWAGVDVAKDGVPMNGRFPLVVLSHGMYGNAMNQNWLADALVQEGYIAVTLNHPGTSTWLRGADNARQMWERPKDVSRTISFLLSDPKLKGRIDLERIYMAGHSLGGMTALMLAGGRYAPTQIDATCAANPNALICGLIEMWQLGKTPEDRAAISQDLSDPRIKGFALLDLGATQTFSAQSLAKVTRPMLVIGAPKDSKGSLDLDIESRALVAQLPKENTTYIEPASLTHFDFLGTCTDKAIAILDEEVPSEAYVCFDGTDERIADHAIIAKALIEFFAKH